MLIRQLGLKVEQRELEKEARGSLESRGVGEASQIVEFMAAGVDKLQLQKHRTKFEQPGRRISTPNSHEQPPVVHLGWTQNWKLKLPQRVMNLVAARA